MKPNLKTVKQDIIKTLKHFGVTDFTIGRVLDNFKPLEKALRNLYDTMIFPDDDIWESTDPHAISCMAYEDENCTKPKKQILIDVEEFLGKKEVSV